MPEFEIWSSADDLVRNEADWIELFDRCPEAPPFLHPAWQLTWWQFFGTAELQCVAMRDSGRLAALAACFRYDGQLVFIGNGITDQQDILADETAPGAMLDWLMRYPLDLQELPEGS